MARENLYSRLVAWLKILLPLAALGILSSVVFFARDADEHRTIPFVTQEGGPDTPDERVTQPEYVALTGDGSSVTLHADQVRPVNGNNQIVDADVMEGLLRGVDGRDVTASAPEGRIDFMAQTADFSGDVNVETSDGFAFVAPNLTTRLDVTHAESDGPVSGTAPIGTLDAGAFRYDMAGDGTSLLVFHGGVKLIYQPRNRKADE